MHAVFNQYTVIFLLRFLPRTF